MRYVQRYASPLGDLILAAQEEGLIGLWFEGQKHFPEGLKASDDAELERAAPLFQMARRWLDIYFSGQEPGFSVPIHLEGTAFQTAVWRRLCAIPYGQTMTYGEIAGQMAREEGRAHLSAQAVGGAVGRNPVSILVPCHRVVGANGRLTGYAGGLERKQWLLELERAGSAAR